MIASPAATTLVMMAAVMTTTITTTTNAQYWSAYNANFFPYLIRGDWAAEGATPHPSYGFYDNFPGSGYAGCRVWCRSAILPERKFYCCSAAYDKLFALAGGPKAYAKYQNTLDNDFPISSPPISSLPIRSPPVSSLPASSIYTTPNK
ncbi:unnamed protein product, partial [Meganyctiphanes norvegica]